MMGQMNIHLIIFAFFLLLTSTTISFAKDSQELIVGMELSYPPFEMTDAQGKPTGISVEIATALAKKMKRSLKIENIAFDGLIASLKTGKIDLIISSMTATEERSKSIDFSIPYLKTGLTLLLGAESKVTGIQDLDKKGHIIVVKKGTTGHQYATNHFKLASINVLDKEASCVLEVIQKKADAFIYDSMSVYQHHKRNSATTKLILRPFKEEFWAIGVKIGNTELKTQVDTFIEEFKANKGFEKLGDQFLKEEKEYFKNANIPFYF